jgi:hypothetical protein
MILVFNKLLFALLLSVNAFTDWILHERHSLAVNAYSGGWLTRYSRCFASFVLFDSIYVEYNRIPEPRYTYCTFTLGHS